MRGGRSTRMRLPWDPKATAHRGRWASIVAPLPNKRPHMKLRTFRPSTELLEDRLTPAGNVLAQLTGGSLLLTGDAQGNVLSVTQSAPGEFTVTPQDGTT